MLANETRRLLGGLYLLLIHFFWVLILAALALGGCFNSLNQPGEPETGRVELSIAGGGERTVLPDAPVFSKYVFKFTANDGQAAHDPVPVTSGNTKTVELASGSWTIDATGYVRIRNIGGITDGEYEAAWGTASITVSVGKTQALDIDLRGAVDGKEKGILSYDIKIPADATAAVMKILTLTGTEKDSVDLKSNPKGNNAIDPGYYLVTLTLNNTRSKTEVVHIYSSLTTKLERDFTSPVFSSIEEMAAWLSNAAPNTKEDPYEIRLGGLYLEKDLSQGEDQLGKLYNALKMVPSESVTAYKSASGWSDYTDRINAIAAR